MSIRYDKDSAEDPNLLSSHSAARENGDDESRETDDENGSREYSTETLRELIRKTPGQRLPSERELALRLKISRPTLRSILSGLQKEGLVESRPKSGTYVVDHQARALQLIVLLIDADLKLNDDPFIHAFIDSIQRAVQAADARFLIERTTGKGHRAAHEEGVLTLGLIGSELIDDQRQDDPPMVGLLLNSNARPNRRASVFQLEDVEAGRNAAKHLIDDGCKEIVFVGRDDIPASRERLSGVEEVASANSVKLQFVSSHLNYSAGIRTGRALKLDHSQMPVGIIATNDWLALGLRMGLREAHQPVERNTKIVSFDGLSVTKEPSLGIVSLVVPMDEIATDAVDELQRLHRLRSATGRIIRYALR